VFAKLRKASISFVTSVRPYRTTQLKLDGRLIIFRKSVDNMHVSSNSDKKNGYLT